MNNKYPANPMGGRGFPPNMQQPVYNNFGRGMPQMPPHMMIPPQMPMYNNFGRGMSPQMPPVVNPMIQPNFGGRGGVNIPLFNKSQQQVVVGQPIPLIKNPLQTQPIKPVANLVVKKDDNPSQKKVPPTVWVGKISSEVKDELLTNILESCGKITKWRRVAKMFGFCDFESFSDLLCAIRVLDGFELLGSALKLKVDEKFNDLLKQKREEETKEQSEKRDSDAKQKINQALSEFQKNTDDEISISLINGNQPEEIPAASEEKLNIVSNEIKKFREKQKLEKEKKEKIEKKKKDQLKQHEEYEKLKHFEREYRHLKDLRIREHNAWLRQIEREDQNYREKINSWDTRQKDRLEHKERKIYNNKSKIKERLRSIEKEKQNDDDWWRHVTDGRRKRERNRELESDMEEKKKELDIIKKKEEEEELKRQEIELKKIQEQEELKKFQQLPPQQIPSQIPQQLPPQPYMLNNMMPFQPPHMMHNPYIQPQLQPQRQLQNPSDYNPFQVNEDITKKNQDSVNKKMDVVDDKDNNNNNDKDNSENDKDNNNNNDKSSSNNTNNNDDNSNNNEQKIKKKNKKKSDKKEKPKSIKEKGPVILNLNSNSSFKITGIKRKAIGFDDEEDNTNNDDNAPKKKRKLVKLDYASEGLQTEEEKILVSIKHLENKEDISKSIADQIPTDNSSLFSFPIDWEFLNNNNIIEEKIRPWINKRVLEYLGEEEPDMVDFIIEKLLIEHSPSALLTEFEDVLEEEAEIFIKKLWRILIFHVLEAKQQKLH